MSSLIKGLTSDYFHAFNQLRPSNELQSIIVYVEGFEDIAFWHNILSPYEVAQQIKFEIKTYSNEQFMGGCEGLKKLFPNTGDFLIVCLDSDYHNYLLTEYFGTTVNDNPYVLQTYSHSIENLKCYAESLSGLCVQASCNTDEVINPKLFLQHYSNIIYELFIWFLYFQSIKDSSSFCNTKFCAEIKILEKPKIDELEQKTLNKVQEKVAEKLKQLQQDYPEIVQHIEPLAKKMSALGVSEDNAYLFIQGHTLYDNVVLIFLKPICYNLGKSPLEKINLITNPQEKLDKRTNYLSSPRYKNTFSN